MKLTRSQIKQGLEQVPMNTILGVSSKALTSKQKAFCKEVAMGSTGSEALRKAYNRKGKTKTIANDAHKLRKRPDINATIEQYEAAIQAQAYQTPAGLRALVIQTLVQAMTDENEKASVKIAAAKTLGTVTEVAAFTERKEVRTITSSEDTKAKLLAKLRDMMKANAEDAEVIDTDSLMVELQNSGADATHPSPIAPLAQEESLSQLHSTPHKPSQDFSDSACASNPPDADPTPSIEEDPTSGVDK